MVTGTHAWSESNEIAALEKADNEKKLAKKSKKVKKDAKKEEVKK